MKRNIKLTIEYDGTLYRGWQAQNSRHSKKSTIQEAIERTLNKILQEKIKVVGSGRTDAGVHAKAQVANFKTASGIALSRLQKALNGLLADDIVIVRAQEVAQDFHSRFDVKSKIYRYSILNRPYPQALLRDQVHFCPYRLNMKLMKRQARLLLGRHDLRSFKASDSGAANTIRTIKKINISKRRHLIHIDIEADGFLRGMARTIAGTLIEIGRGKALDMRQLLALKDRTKAGPTAPAKGLCLMKVKYK